MAQSHGINDEVFQALQKQCLWETGAPVGVDFGLFDFRDLLHAREPKRNIEVKDNK